jgi:hypothetical protein
LLGCSDRVPVPGKLEAIVAYFASVYLTDLKGLMLLEQLDLLGEI